VTARPSEARKRGSGGGSPRKHDDLLTGRSDLDAQWGSEGALPVTARPSEGRKRVLSGGGSPRRHDDLLTGRSVSKSRQ
jgi:hypothetical protein